LKHAGVISRRLILALVAYIALAVLIWTTMDAGAVSTPVGKIPFRTLTLAIVGLFAVRTIMHAIREHQMAGDREAE